MSAYKVVFLECDECHHTIEDGDLRLPVGHSLKAVRDAAAIEFGWTRVRGKRLVVDLCGGCSPDGGS